MMKIPAAGVGDVRFAQSNAKDTSAFADGLAAEVAAWTQGGRFRKDANSLLMKQIMIPDAPDAGAAAVLKGLLDKGPSFFEDPQGYSIVAQGLTIQPLGRGVYTREELFKPVTEQELPAFADLSLYEAKGALFTRVDSSLSNLVDRVLSARGSDRTVTNLRDTGTGARVTYRGADGSTGIVTVSKQRSVNELVQRILTDTNA